MDKDDLLTKEHFLGDPENPVCTYEKCGLGHYCTSGCNNDYDCPCTSEHPQKEDVEPKESFGEAVNKAFKAYQKLINLMDNVYGQITPRQGDKF